MLLNEFLLWAAIIPFILVLVHFSAQRKLKDRRSVLFYILIICGLVNVLAGLLLASVLNGRILSPDNFIEYLLLEIIYISEYSLPYLLLEFAALNCRQITSFWLKVARCMELICLIVILSNPWTNWISYIGLNRLPYVGKYYALFVCSILIWYAAVILYTLFKRHYMYNHQNITFVEASLIMICGIILQNILHLQLYVGYMATLAVTVLYFSTQNRYAYIDFTTHIFNANYFNYWLWEHLQYHKPVHIIGICIADTEKIRKTYGIDTELHSLIANDLWKITPQHTVFRVRTNNYAICTTRVLHHSQIQQQLQAIFNHDFSLNGRNIRCSVVVAEIEHAEQKFSSTEEILNYMSVLLHPDKNYLGLQTIHDNETIRNNYETQKKIEQYILHALADDLFDVWYQPIYSVSQKKIVGAEALSRLYHPELGWINPELFIKLATRDGQIFQLMPMQLHRICRFLRQNPRVLEQLENIKINLSPSEIIKQGYVEELISIIRSYNILPEKFQFEVTESAATEYTPELNQCIKTLQQAGIRLCLDDFGSGYANLSSVLRLPFSVIKMDRSLLLGITENEKTAVFYHSMIETLHALGYHIVSEGVETKAEVCLLESWNVDMIQGYYFSKPLCEKDLLHKLL